MKARRLLLSVLAAAAVSTCPGQDSAGKYASADTTYRYLREVGRVRAQVNADNRTTIPALLQKGDPAALGAQAKTLEGYRQDLDNIDPTDVDPDVVQFKANFNVIVEAYKAICVDSAELFRGVAAAAAKPGSSPLLHPKGGKLDLLTNDTLGAVDSLLTLLDQSAGSGRAALQPAVDKVRADEDQLRKAKDVHHDFTQKLKSELTDRYQGTDWSTKDILP
jgi:hypothetical protein